MEANHSRQFLKKQPRQQPTRTLLPMFQKQSQQQPKTLAVLLLVKD